MRETKTRRKPGDSISWTVRGRFVSAQHQQAFHATEPILLGCRAMAPQEKQSHPTSVDGDRVSPASSLAQRNGDDDLLTHESFRSILSSHQRAGRWEAADEIEVRAIFGEVTLDFTRADLPPSGVIEIDALAFCGEVHVIVPEGAEIELEGTPILGSIESIDQVQTEGTRERIPESVTGDRDEDLPPHPDPLYFRIDGRAIMGSIKVTCR